jgi:hypothetical protein
MKKLISLLIAFVLFCSHDMFLKMDSFYLKPDQATAIHLYNGTFEKSENVITRDRMQDVSLLGNGNREKLTDDHWTEDGMVTVLNFQTGEAGTWVAGVSTRPNNIELSAQEFNDYLEHDGVLDMLEWRKENNALDQPAVEKYSKHVKAVFQVGDIFTVDWQMPLGYPIEFVPQRNPYELHTGEILPLQLLKDGKPLANQLIFAGFSEGSHGHQHDAQAGMEHRHDEAQLTTDAEGVVNLMIDHDGKWYVRTIHMALSGEEGLTHESNWATLTFEAHGHSHEQGTDSSVRVSSIPRLWFWALGIAVVLTGVFVFLKRK